MSAVNVYRAKSSFSKLLARAEAGETIIIARNGRPVAQFGPIQPARRPVVFGDMRGRIRIRSDFDAWDDQDERDWFGA
jgi:prevent-host-death family protein